MTEKKILIITNGNYLDLGIVSGELSGWSICTVSDFDAARKVIASQSYLTGIVLDSDGKLGKDEAERFFLLNNIRWIGLFRSHQLQCSSVRQLIATHLFDYHTFPLDMVRLRNSLGHAHGMAMLSKSTTPNKRHAGARHIEGQSVAVRCLRSHIDKIAAVNAPVLISGESGSGKELAAQEIHAQSLRAGGPFIAINCAAISPSLLHSELFGYERGAFTGAAREKQGLIESASGGSIFLDEIGDLPLDQQASLLRFLQERTICRVGGTRTISADARVIAATHVNLPKAVAAGRFREDLYYRLSVFPIRVPPLRERMDDLPLLTEIIFEKFTDEKSPQLQGVSKQAMRAMMRHNWPGNIRELINRMRRAMVLAEQRLISPADLDLVSADDSAIMSEDLHKARCIAERTAIWNSLIKCGNNISKAAVELGVSRMTLYRRMDRYAIRLSQEDSIP